MVWISELVSHWLQLYNKVANDCAIPLEFSWYPYPILSMILLRRSMQNSSGTKACPWQICSWWGPVLLSSSVVHQIPNEFLMKESLWPSMAVEIPGSMYKALSHRLCCSQSRWCIGQSVWSYNLKQLLSGPLVFLTIPVCALLMYWATCLFILVSMIGSWIGLVPCRDPWDQDCPLFG